MAEEFIDQVLKKDFGNDDRVPLATITGLSHDLGKATGYIGCGTNYSHNHGKRSAAILKELGSVTDLHRLAEILRAVEDHHLPSKDPLTCLLKEADGCARETEQMQITSKYVIKPANMS